MHPDRSLDTSQAITSEDNVRQSLGLVKSERSRQDLAEQSAVHAKISQRRRWMSYDGPSHCSDRLVRKLDDKLSRREIPQFSCSQPHQWRYIGSLSCSILCSRRMGCTHWWHCPISCEIPKANPFSPLNPLRKLACALLPQHLRQRVLHNYVSEAVMDRRHARSGTRSCDEIQVFRSDHLFVETNMKLVVRLCEGKLR